jgi:hypothetical protein
VKNQYFGDKRDLFKFTLLETLVDEIPGIEALTCVWLLTPPASNNDGNRHFRAQTAQSELGAFLKRCLDAGRRDVREFAQYMAGRSANYVSYGDSPINYFTSDSRSTYFDGIPANGLRRAVVFFDPDNGLEPRSVLSTAHIRLAELRNVFDRMDSDSVAVVYQHLPRQPARTFWPSAAARLRDALGSPTCFVASGDVGFLIALRSASNTGYAASALERFRKAWPNPVMTTLIS